MSKFWRHFISNGFENDPVPPLPPVNPGPPAEDAEALDAFSRVVVRVADAIQPAVVNLRAGGRRGGSGSGVLFTPDGFLLTNHHVVQGNARVRVRVRDGSEHNGRLVG